MLLVGGLIHELAGINLLRNLTRIFWISGVRRKISILSRNSHTNHEFWTDFIHFCVQFSIFSSTSILQIQPSSSAASLILPNNYKISNFWNFGRRKLYDFEANFVEQWLKIAVGNHKSSSENTFWEFFLQPGLSSSKLLFAVKVPAMGEWTYS